MKILLIHTSYLLKGGEDVVFELEKNLLSKRHEVEILHFQNKNKIAGAIQFFASLWSFKKSKIVKKKINSFSPDIVHLHNWHFASGPLIIRVIKKLNIPLLATLHNFRLICPSGTLFYDKKLYLPSLKENFPWTAIKDKVYRNSYLQTFLLSFIVWFHKKIGTWQMVDKYICPSLFMVDFFCKSTLKLKENNFVVKANFSESIKNIETIKSGNHFLFIGRLVEEKGIRCLLDAFKNTNETIKIIGDGPLKSLVEDFAKKNKNIIYLGFLPKERINKELQEANALIFPSIWLEPFGLTIIEAFANKCAVISGDNGAPKSIIKNTVNGFHFKNANSQDLHKKIIMWQNLSNNKKEEIRDNAYKSHQKLYSKESQKIIIEDIYKSIIKN